MRPSFGIIVAELDDKYIDCKDKLIMILKSIDIFTRVYYFPTLQNKVECLIGTKDLKLTYSKLYSNKLLILPSGWPIMKNQIEPIMRLINRIIDDIYTDKNGL